MSRPPRFRPRAVADLESIWDYTADRWGVAQADRYVRDLHDACRALARGEASSLDASAIRAGYRKLRRGRHLIFHRTTEDGAVEIVRILHERMDVAALLAAGG